MAQQTNSTRKPDDDMARQSGAVSEDVQPVATDQDADKTAQGSLEGTAGAERTDTADDLETE